jgi:S-adenosylmethionine:diacylglycerol 3-amino-3-carboxypropyl transferase
MGSKRFFKTLNYTLANEDTRMELAMLPQGAAHVCAVAGSGGRVLPLLARAPRRITVVDLAQEQLYITELRIEAARCLEYADFLAFWGYPPLLASPPRRERLFGAITTLSSEARDFWRSYLTQVGWRSPLYDGKWEQTFIALSKVNRLITGAAGAGMFDAETMPEFVDYMRRDFPHARWRAVVAVLGNAAVFNALLYRGSFPEKNIPQSFYEFYHGCFDKLFGQAPARESFFLQLLFYGKLRVPAGNPVECEPEVFARAKAALAQGAEVAYRRVNIVERDADVLEPPVDFMSFSDVPSYFTGTTERAFLQRLRPQLASGALVVIRHYLHLPQGTDRSGYSDVTADYAEAIAAEKVGVYLTEVLRRDEA